MGDISNIMAAFHRQLWAMLPDKLAEIQSFLYARARGDDLSQRGEQLAKARQSRLDAVFAEVQSIDPQALRRSDGVVVTGRTAVVPVFGVLSQRASAMERTSGVISTEELAASLGSLVADKQIRNVAMLWDSPGGSVFGMRNLAEQMRAYRDQKKITGIVSSLAASAGLWAISQSSEIVAEPSSQIGSHGVWTAHADESGFWEKAGVKVTLVGSSAEKIAGNPYEPLSEAAKADMQQKVNFYMDEFTEDVAKGRGITPARVLSQFGRGLMFTPAEARERGMVDRVSTFGDTLRRLGATERAESPVESTGTCPKVAAAQAVAREASLKWAAQGVQ